MKRINTMVFFIILAVSSILFPSIAFAGEFQVVQFSGSSSMNAISSAETEESNSQTAEVSQSMVSNGVSHSSADSSLSTTESGVDVAPQPSSSSVQSDTNAVRASKDTEIKKQESAPTVLGDTQSLASGEVGDPGSSAVSPSSSSLWIFSGSGYTYLGSETGWVVTSISPDGTDYGLQRYWVDVSKKLAINRLVTASEAGYYAYATAQGFVARGKYVASDGSVYLADNNGKLEDAGWLITGSYADGNLQRYYIDSSTHAARTGLFDVGGSSYYGIFNEGYEFRGAATVDGTIRVADNSGVLAKSQWVVSDAFGQGLQRYWLGANAAPSSGLIDAGNGWYAYGTLEGYVVRGKYISSDGKVYLANNDGRLENTGWLISDAYGDGLQRYYIEADSHACVLGESDGGWPHYTLPSGYVLRGPLTTSAGTYIADNDGKLAKSSWVVTAVFGQGVQRYWFDSDATMSVNEVVDGGTGWWAYATSNGYVLRGTYTFTDSDGFTNIYVADNDGKLISSSSSDGAGWLITGDYTDGALQRYYVNPKTHALLIGFFTVDGSPYYSYPNSRYVLRGTYSYDSNHMLLADNDGKMANTAGWLVTDAYTGGLQRYYLELAYSGSAGAFYGAKLGLFSVDGNSYFGRYDEGYVVRGDYYYSGTWYEGDNDGVLHTIKSLLNGFDISEWQNGIDLGSTTYDFAIIKAAQGTDYANPYFSTWANTVLNAGKMLGIYHYADGTGAVAEAQYFVNTIGNYIGRAVLFLDWETSEDNDPLKLGYNSAFSDTGYAKTFLDTVYNLTGVKPLIYMSQSVTNSLNWSDVANAGYGLWVAQYWYANTDSPDSDKGKTYGYLSNPKTYGSISYWSSAMVYQYSHTGILSGYDHDLDLDLFYGGRPLWNQLASKS